MKKLLFIITLAFLISGCSKPINYKSCVGYSENVEVAIDDDNNAYITDLDRNIQIILVCHIKNGYRNQDFANQIYNEVLVWHPSWNKNEMESYGKSRIDYCVPEAFKIKEEYDSHFKRELKKYYVFYKEVNVYRLFNK